VPFQAPGVVERRVLSAQSHEAYQLLNCWSAHSNSSHTFHLQNLCQNVQRFGLHSLHGSSSCAADMLHSGFLLHTLAPALTFLVGSNIQGSVANTDKMHIPNIKLQNNITNARALFLLTLGTNENKLTAMKVDKILSYLQVSHLIQASVQYLGPLPLW
jgi:hypothetical protein